MEFTPSVPIYSADEKYRSSLQSLVKSNRGRWKSDRQKDFLSGVLTSWEGDPNRDVPFPVNPPDGTEYAVWFTMYSNMYGNRYHEIFWMDDDGVVGTNRVVEPTGVKSRDRARRLGWKVQQGWRRDSADSSSSFKDFVMNAEEGVVLQFPEGMKNPYKDAKMVGRGPYYANEMALDENGNALKTLIFDNFGNFVVQGPKRGGYPIFRELWGENFSEHREEIEEALRGRTPQEILEESISNIPRLQAVHAPQEVMDYFQGRTPTYRNMELPGNDFIDIIIDSAGDMVILPGDNSNLSVYTLKDILRKMVMNGSTIRSQEVMLEGISEMTSQASSSINNKFAEISFDPSTIANIIGDRE